VLRGGGGGMAVHIVDLGTDWTCPLFLHPPSVRHLPDCIPTARVDPAVKRMVCYQSAMSPDSLVIEPVESVQSLRCQNENDLAFRRQMKPKLDRHVKQTVFFSLMHQTSVPKRHLVTPIYTTYMYVAAVALAPPLGACLLAVWKDVAGQLLLLRIIRWTG
jgi:hypothetical protein